MIVLETPTPLNGKRHEKFPLFFITILSNTVMYLKVSQEKILPTMLLGLEGFLFPRCEIELEMIKHFERKFYEYLR